MIDITNATWRSNRFGGSERKRTLIYDGSTYMVKFPDPVRSTKKTSLSYINNQFSEHIGCSIFRHLGIPAQETFLAMCIDPMKKTLVSIGKTFQGVCASYRKDNQQIR